jgi:hypothetical protein
VIAESGALPRFQAVLVGDWLARFEQRFPDLLPQSITTMFGGPG